MQGCLEGDSVLIARRLKIGVLLGSTREGRLNDRVAKFVIDAIQKDHEAVIFDPMLMDFPQTQQMINLLTNPSAVPANIQELCDRMRGVDAVVMVSPEYNFSIPPGLSNMLANIPPMICTWKPCAFVTYSISSVGGWRCGVQLRQLAGCLGFTCIQKQMGVATAQVALDALGQSKDAKLNGELRSLLGQLYWLANALNSHKQMSPAPPSAF